MRHKANTTSPTPVFPNSLLIPPAAGRCLFLQLLSLDVRFEIYKHIALSESSETLIVPVIHVVDILEPQKNSLQPLTALLNTSHQIHQELLIWYSKNRSWLRYSGDQIFVHPTLKNTRYYLKWTDDFGASFTPSKEVESWYRFCFENPAPSVIGHLTIDFHIDLFEVPSTIRILFSDPLPYRAIQKESKRRITLTNKVSI